MKEQDQEIDMETDELSKDGDIEYQRRIELETQAKGIFIVQSSIFDKVSTLKEELQKQITVQTRRTVDQGQFTKILYHGRALSDDEFIGNIADGVSDIRFFVIEKTSVAYDRVNNINILHRNVNACASSAKHGYNPSERERWNEPATATPHKPNVAYFSEMLIGLSRTYNDVAANMRKLSTVLNNDIKYSDQTKCEKQRRIIQNNFDSLRYAAPLCVNLSKLKIPLNNVNAEIKLA